MAPLTTASIAAAQSECARLGLAALELREELEELRVARSRLEAKVAGLRRSGGGCGASAVRANDRHVERTLKILEEKVGALQARLAAARGRRERGQAAVNRARTARLRARADSSALREELEGRRREVLAIEAALAEARAEEAELRRGQRLARERDSERCADLEERLLAMREELAQPDPMEDRLAMQEREFEGKKQVMQELAAKKKQALRAKKKKAAAAKRKKKAEAVAVVAAAAARKGRPGATSFKELFMVVAAELGESRDVDKVVGAYKEIVDGNHALFKRVSDADHAIEQSTTELRRARERLRQTQAQFQEEQQAAGLLNKDATRLAIIQGIAAKLQDTTRVEALSRERCERSRRALDVSRRDIHTLVAVLRLPPDHHALGGDLGLEAPASSSSGGGGTAGAGITNSELMARLGVVDLRIDEMLAAAGQVLLEDNPTDRTKPPGLTYEARKLVITAPAKGQALVAACLRLAAAKATSSKGRGRSTAGPSPPALLGDLASVKAQPAGAAGKSDSRRRNAEPDADDSAEEDDCDDMPVPLFREQLQQEIRQHRRK